MHTKRDYRVTIIFVWLVVVTVISLCGVFHTDKNCIKLKRVYDLPPLEYLEVDIEGGD
jgi:hypothetical protein